MTVWWRQPARQPRLAAKSLASASTDNATRDNEFRICHKAILRPCLRLTPTSPKPYLFTPPPPQATTKPTTTTPTASHVNKGAAAAAEKQCESLADFRFLCFSFTFIFIFSFFFFWGLKGTITFIWGLSPCNTD